MPGLYTDSPLQKRLTDAKSAAQSQTGMTNPEAVKQALTESTFGADQPLQEAQRGQASSMNAIKELASFDQQIAGQVRSANTQQMQANQAQRAQFAQYGSIDPNNPQATIAAGPVDFNATQITTAPAPGLLSPFVGASISQGQTRAALDTYSLADQARAARERYLGSEVTQLVAMYKARLDEERAAKEQAEAEKKVAFERSYGYAQEAGGSVKDPVTGQIYSFKTPEDKALAEAKLKASQQKQSSVVEQLKTRLGRSGKSVYEEVIDGLGSFSDVLRENPDLSQEEIATLAQVNTSRFGGFKESDSDLAGMGLSPELLKSAGVSRMPVSGGVGDPVQEVFRQGGADLLVGKSQEEREKQARQIIDSSGTDVSRAVENYRKSLPLASLITPAEKGDLDKQTDFLIELKRAAPLFKDKESFIGGTGYLASFMPQSAVSEETRNMRRAAESLTSERLKAISGTTISEQEVQRLQKFLPTSSKSETQNAEDIDRLMRGLQINQELFALSKQEGITKGEALYKYGDEVFRKYGENSPVSGSQPSQPISVGRFTVEVE